MAQTGIPVSCDCEAACTLSCVNIRFGTGIPEWNTGIIYVINLN